MKQRDWLKYAEKLTLHACQSMPPPYTDCRLSPRQSTTKDEDNRQVVREVDTKLMLLHGIAARR